MSLPPGLTADEVTIGSDPRLPGQLLLYPGQPADHLYSTTDGGATWRQPLCPGALKGACPSAVIDNVPSAPGSPMACTLMAFTRSTAAATRPGRASPSATICRCRPTAIRILAADPACRRPDLRAGQHPHGRGAGFP